MNTKFLGVYMDNKLSWKKHIEYTAGKVSRGIGIVLRARRLLNSAALKTLYYSFVYPFFSYCNHVWGSACPTNLEKLVLLQKRVIRIIAGAKYLDHTDPLFKKLGLLKLTEINTYAFCKFMYKWYHSKLPTAFTNSFMYVHDVHYHNTRQSRELYPTKINTNLGKTRYRYKGAHVWNHLLKAKVNPATSEAVFSKCIKQCIKVGLI